MLNAFTIFGSENFPDARAKCNYGSDKDSKAHGEIASYFRHLAKDSILQPCITEKDL